MAPIDLAFRLEARSTVWTVQGPASSGRSVPSPFTDEGFRRKVLSLSRWASRPTPLDRPDSLDGTETYIRNLADEISRELTESLLGKEDRHEVARALARAGPVRLRIRAESAGKEWDPAAEAALALPWELLSPERPGTYPVREGRLAVIREAVTDSSPHLSEPSGPLTLAAILAAPEDRVAFAYEQESFRLAVALAPLGQRAVFCNLGTLDDLIDLIASVRAGGIHFRGHSFPGGLLFEDELGFSKEIPIAELRRRLASVLLDPRRRESFPGFFFLSAPFTTLPGETASCAAALHQSGLPQVIGFFGPVDEELNTRLEERFYGLLAQGKSGLEAAERARQALLEPVGDMGERAHYPFAWIQLAVYHRGPDLPLATPMPEGCTPALQRQTLDINGLPVLEHGFIGRRGVLHEIRRKVERDGQRLVVIQGLGGLGKTALAGQLLTRVFAQEPADQLVLRCQEAPSDPAEALLELRRQAEEHGRLYGFPNWDQRIRKLREGNARPIAGLMATLRLLSKERHRLVVFVDNAEALQTGPTTERPGPLGSWLPGLNEWWKEMEHLAEVEGCLTLVTTRYAFQDLSPRAHLSLPPMERPDSLRLMGTFEALHRLPLAVRVRLAKRVDGHPRTIELLDRFLLLQVEESSSVDDVWNDLIAPHLPAQAHAIQQDLLLEKLWEKLSPRARKQALALCVLRRPAPQYVIDRMGDSRDELIRGGWLTRYREQSRHAENLEWATRWGLHGIVRDFLAARTDSENTESHRAAADAWEGWIEHESSVWTDYGETAYHLHSIYEGDRAWPIVEKLVVFLRDAARYREAKKILLGCEAAGTSHGRLAMALLLLAQMRRNLGEVGPELTGLLERASALTSSDLDLARVYSEQGSLLVEQGRPKAAEALLEKAAGLKKQLAPDDLPSLRATLVELAAACTAQEKFEKGRGLFEQSLSLVARSLGKGHPQYSGTLHEMGRLEVRRGNHSEAEEFLQEALRIAAERHGDSSPSYGTSLHVMAEILLSQGRFVEAEGLLRRVLDIDDQTIGNTHPLYADSLHLLAQALLQQGNLMGARRTLSRCLDIKRTALGEGHRSSGATLQLLAHVALASGEYKKAQDLARAALAILLQCLGPSHSETGAAMYLVGVIHSKRGEPAEAKAHLSRACALSAESLGRNHSSHATCLQELAWVLQSEGSLGEAETLFRQAVDIHEKSLGKRHPIYFSALRKLAGNLSHQGRLLEAEVLLWPCLTHAEGLARDHPQLADTLHALAGVIGKQGRLPEAERLYRRALAVFEKVFHDEHPDLIPILANLAGILAKAGNFAEAKPLLRRALDLARSTEGRNEAQIGRILSILAKVLFQQGDPGACRVAEEAVEVSRAAYNQGHPVLETLITEKDIICGEGG